MLESLNGFTPTRTPYTRPPSFRIICIQDSSACCYSFPPTHLDKFFQYFYPLLYDWCEFRFAVKSKSLKTTCLSSRNYTQLVICLLCVLAYARSTHSSECLWRKPRTKQWYTCVVRAPDHNFSYKVHARGQAITPIFNIDQHRHNERLRLCRSLQVN